MAIPLGVRQCEFTHALALLIIQAAKENKYVKLQELNRTIQEQKENVRKGTSKTLDSRHLDKLAVDMYIYDMGTKAPVEDLEQYRSLGEYWESLGGRWGGRFGLENMSKNEQNANLGWDPFHYEFTRKDV